MGYWRDYLIAKWRTLKKEERLELMELAKKEPCKCGTCVRYHVGNCYKDLGCNICNPAGIGIHNQK